VSVISMESGGESGYVNNIFEVRNYLTKVRYWMFMLDNILIPARVGFCQVAHVAVWTVDRIRLTLVPCALILTLNSLA